MSESTKNPFFQGRNMQETKAEKILISLESQESRVRQGFKSIISFYAFAAKTQAIRDLNDNSLCSMNFMISLKKLQIPHSSFFLCQTKAFHKNFFILHHVNPFYNRKTLNIKL